MPDVTTAALLVTLAAAVVHALWNQLLAGSRDPAASSAVGLLVGAVVVAPLALVDLRWEAAAWPWVAGSVACSVGYFVGLAAAYRRAPMGVIYPVARGSAPVLVLLGGWLALDQDVGWYAAAGVLVVVAGILLVRGIGPGVRPAQLLLALGVGTCIAGYTLLDAVALGHASPIALLVVVHGVSAVARTAALARTSGGRRALAGTLRGRDAWRTVATGLGIYLAYGLVLVALTMAPAGPVSAVRETSVAVAVLLLAATGQERVTRVRLAGAVLVAAGVALVVA
ncbi:EamA family transporter [Nocardioides pantholopis]|uniref:EamA family transporter n=1 Tax=Nocardioides pantholopis TaxID=2483798 RepID=UPI000F07E867|nr:EamA family transporter [Nocardioides pantholopis]